MSNLNSAEANNPKDISFWSSAWEKDRAFWQKENVHPGLLAFWDKLFPVEVAVNEKSILFPLCGQTLDMVYCFRDKKMNVIGIEGVESAIAPFFQNNSLVPFHKSAISHSSTAGTEIDAKIYSFHPESNGPNLKIVEQNYFETSNIPGLDGFPKVDAVFDRGSFTAIDPSVRFDYVKTIISWHKPDGRILLNVPNYDQSLVNGPPHSVDPEQVKELYSSYGFKVELINSTPGVIHGKANASYNLFLISK